MRKRYNPADTRRKLLKVSAAGCLVILAFHFGTIIGSFIWEVLK